MTKTRVDGEDRPFGKIETLNVGRLKEEVLEKGVNWIW